MILIIDNYDSFTYNLYQLVCQIDPEVKVIRNDKITIADIERIAPRAIILSPGPGRPEEAGICVACVSYFSGKIPLLGVCLGHQAIGQAFGGRIVQAPQIIHGKASPVLHNQSPFYDSIPSPFTAGRYHSLIIEKKSLPKELIIQAQTKDDIIMGIKHQQHPTFGVQFHPESILSADGEKLIHNFLTISGALTC